MNLQSSENVTSSHKLKTKSLVWIGFCCLVIFFYFHIDPTQNDIFKRVLEADIRYPVNASIETFKNENFPENDVKKAKTKITILFWTGYWIWSHFGMGVGNRGFVNGGCELQNCYTTTNKKKLKVVDAVVFHGEDLNNDNTIKELYYLKKLRAERHERDEKAPIFVYFMKEPPHSGNRLNDSVFDDFFDVTITYQPDSDVAAGYGRIVPHHPENDLFWPNWRPFQPTAKTSSRDLSFKTKDIAWIVSHCETESHRERYVKTLKNATNLKIDVYGSCGDENLTLPPRPAESEYNRQAMAQVSTYKTILKPYKFYLSFENTFCKDYITEKFFYTFASSDGPIPVALGGLSSEDYARAAPPHSFLHIDDFHSPNDLAQELERLSKNATAFREYFWWQEFYKLENEWDLHVKGQCKLCKILNQILNDEYDIKDYKDMNKFWDLKSRCKTPNF